LLHKVQDLIDNAAKNHFAGNKSALARALGVHAQTVSAWYAEREPLPLDTRAMLAEFAGYSPVSEITSAVLERAKRKPWRAQLEAALKKSAAGVVVMWISFAGSGASDAHAGTLATADNV
jgi:hypothetical protein